MTDRQGDVVSGESAGDATAANRGDGDAGAAGGGTTSNMEKAYMSPWAWARFVLPAALGLWLDLWVKAYSFPDPWVHDELGMRYAGRHPAGIDPQSVIPGVLGFTTTVNPGAVFGSFPGHAQLFLAFSVVALGVILWVFVSSGAKHRVVHLALGLITAGALGNLYDRAMFHGVRDMLKLLCFQFEKLAPDGSMKIVDYYPYIFNVADMLLCLGVPLLIIRWMFVKDESAEQKTAAPV